MTILYRRNSFTVPLASSLVVYVCPVVSHLTPPDVCSPLYGTSTLRTMLIPRPAFEWL